MQARASKENRISSVPTTTPPELNNARRRCANYWSLIIHQLKYVRGLGPKVQRRRQNRAALCPHPTQSALDGLANRLAILFSLCSRWSFFRRWPMDVEKQREIVRLWNRMRRVE